MIELDVPARTINMKVSDAELARRRAELPERKPRYERGFGLMFTKHVRQAHEGCDFDFLETSLRRAGSRAGDILSRPDQSRQINYGQGGMGASAVWWALNCNEEAPHAKTNPARAEPRHILLATDLSAAGDRAFDRAVLLAKQWNASLALCHVVEASSSHPIGIERRIRNVEVEMAELEQRARAAMKQTVSRHILVGDPGDRVVAHARAIKSDLVVTGPAHSGGCPGERLLGSTAARVLAQRARPVPVLAVRRRASGDYRDVAVSVDFSSTSAKAVTATRRLFPKATVTLVHAYDVKPDWSGRNAIKHLDEIEAAERATVKRIAGEEMARLIGTDAGIKSVIIEGESGWVLSDYVDEKRPDLVVTGTHGRTGVRGATIGSTAETLLNKLPCDVLAIRTED